MDKISNREQRLYEELKPIVEPLGAVLLDVEYKTHEQPSVVSVVVTSEDGVSLSDCKVISDQVSPVLDLMAEELKGTYELEVTSPGLERTLRRHQECNYFSGREVRINCYSAYEGEKQWTGKIIEADEDKVMLEVESERVEIPLELIASIKLIFDADEALKSGGSGKDG